MDGDDEEDTLLAEWTFAWWHYSILEGESDRYVEVYGSVSGTEVLVRHPWRKWRYIVLMYLSVGVAICAMSVGFTYMALSVSLGAALFVAVVLWPVCIVNSIMIGRMAYNTFSVPKYRMEDRMEGYESPYR